MRQTSLFLNTFSLPNLIFFHPSQMEVCTPSKLKMIHLTPFVDFTIKFPGPAISERCCSCHVKGNPQFAVCERLHAAARSPVVSSVVISCISVSTLLFEILICCYAVSLWNFQRWHVTRKTSIIIIINSLFFVDKFT